jgi:trans-aconitate methyltransferase
MGGSLRRAAPGASVVGLDGSRELLAMARTRYPGIEFEQADLTQGLPPSVSSQTFDRVVAHMVVMDLATLEPLATSLRQCVAADGIVVVTRRLLSRPTCGHRAYREGGRRAYRFATRQA